MLHPEGVLATLSVQYNQLIKSVPTTHTRLKDTDREREYCGNEGSFVLTCLATKCPVVILNYNRPGVGQLFVRFRVPTLPCVPFPRGSVGNRAANLKAARSFGAETEINQRAKNYEHPEQLLLSVALELCIFVFLSTLRAALQTK